MCSKKYYKTKWDAKKALFSILSRSHKNPWRDELSVYECEDCNGGSDFSFGATISITTKSV